MNISKSFYSGLMTAAVAISVSTGAHAAPFFTGLGDLPGGSFQSLSLNTDNTISNDGSVVVGRGTSAAVSESLIQKFLHNIKFLPADE
jgi:hypothetical protein